MRHPLHRARFWICSALIALLVTGRSPDPDVTAQEADAAATLLNLVNELRLDEGLNPYSQSRLLSDAARRHADDLAAHGLADATDVHLGSDGTDEQARIQEAGYAAWTTEDGELTVDESVWSGRGRPEDALDSFLEDQGQRDNLLSDSHREIGIGIAADDDGRSTVVLSFGARPNVLPIFINDGAASTENSEVAIRLTNEQVRPEGQGTTFIGEAIEIRISSDPAFDELSWEPWTPLVSWTLPNSAGEHTVYVQFRDAAGRTSASADSILLNTGTPTTATSVPPTFTPEPTATPAPPSASEIAPTAASEPGAPTVPPDSAPMPTPSPTAATSYGMVVSITPFPTWTPLPSPEPTRVERDEQYEPTTLSLPALGDYGRPLVTVGILQGAAIVLGLFLALRRSQGR